MNGAELQLLCDMETGESKRLKLHRVDLRYEPTSPINQQRKCKLIDDATQRMF